MLLKPNIFFVYSNVVFVDNIKVKECFQTLRLLICLDLSVQTQSDIEQRQRSARKLTEGGDD